MTEPLDIAFKTIQHKNKPDTYRSYQTGVEFDDFKGGFGWPRDGRPGYIFIIGKEVKTNKLWGVIEIEPDDFTELGRWLKALAIPYHVTYWIVPNEGEFGGYEEALDKICLADDYCLIISTPTLPEDLTLVAETLNREFKQNSFSSPADGPLVRAMPLLNRVDIDDKTTTYKYLPIVTAANIIFEFPNPEHRKEIKKGKDAWDFDKNEEKGRSWMAM